MPWVWRWDRRSRVHTLQLVRGDPGELILYECSTPTLNEAQLRQYYFRAVRHVFGDRPGTPGLNFPTYREVNDARIFSITW